MSSRSPSGIELPKATAPQDGTEFTAVLKSGIKIIYDGGSPNCLDMIGTDAKEEVEGCGKVNHFNGMGGGDRLFGAGGDDFLFGATGNDLLVGGMDNDRLSGGEGADTLVGGAGKDVFIFSSNDDVIDFRADFDTAQNFVYKSKTMVVDQGPISTFSVSNLLGTHGEVLYFDKPLIFGHNPTTNEIMEHIL